MKCSRSFCGSPSRGLPMMGLGDFIGGPFGRTMRGPPSGLGTHPRWHHRRWFEYPRSSRQLRPDATGYQLRANVAWQEFVLLQELLDQIGKDGPGQAAAEWNAGDILAADSGEMGNDVAG